VNNVLIHEFSHISHFVLTETLLPLMKTTAKEPDSDVRIVNVCIFTQGVPLEVLTIDQVSSLAHTRVKPESYATKDSLNKDYGESVGGYLDTYGALDAT